MRVQVGSQNICHLVIMEMVAVVVDKEEDEEMDGEMGMDIAKPGGQRACLIVGGAAIQTSPFVHNLTGGLSWCSA